MNLLIFDIDGTLTRTDSIDHKIFLEMFREKISEKILSLDQLNLKYNTDNGDTHEFFRIIHGREPNDDEVRSMISMVVRKFRKASKTNPEYFKAVEGAHELFDLYLHEQDSNWNIGIATGCWRESAVFKLKKSGLFNERVPLATSDNLFGKDEIITDLVWKAKTMNNVSRYERIVYIGDSYNDLAACLRLKIGFIGIQAENNQQKRNLLGDYCKLENFYNIELINQLLFSA
jgi:phosphoglycolate phosphatase-like HAD superfamily hydrolase